MAIKFALKDNDSKPAAGKSKVEEKTAAAPVSSDDSAAEPSGSDLFDGKPAEQKRKRKK
jgi:hypothetical protein